MKNIDLVMLSKLGLGDGGRETWLNNFLNYIDEDNGKVRFNLITLDLDSNNILLENNKNLIDQHYTYTHNCKKVPISIGYIGFVLKNFFFKKKQATDVLAVGSLNEALATLAGYSLRGVSGNKILWLRTIYTKEKGYALNPFTQKLILKLEIFLINNFFDIIIANGNDTADFYREKGVKCSVIKNSIDLERWSNLEEPSFEGNFKIAFVGRLSEVKGIKAFLEAADILYKNKNMSDIEFHIIGDGPYREEVETYAKRGIVKSYGAVPNSELPELLAKMHCCVALTYLTDFLGGGGVSNALIEQMAAGKIMVCWDNNIFRNVVDDTSAYFVEQDNKTELASTFLKVKNNIDVAIKKSNKVKKLSKEYSIKNHVEKFFSLVESG
ncbi:MULTISPECIES: glycosyltransferase family 4 protein [Psychrobacter]|uniref:glycosyltransferase family 4 protein n=1 Tax=Psychrobacter TaxID=497 RepID=UPI0020948081|nr:glycosyltransferase family 4 protein [Psychrobacter sp. PSP]